MEMPPFNTSKRPRAAIERTALAGLTAAIVAALLLPGDGLSGPVPLPPTASCCFAPITLGDSVVNPPTGGDKDFFSTPPGPPSVMFLFGNNDSMQDYPTPFPDKNSTTGAALPTGCSDANLVSQMATFFDLASPDPAVNGSTIFDNDPDFSASPQFFDPNKYYLTFSSKLPLKGDDNPWTLDSNFRATTGYATPDLACSKYWSSGSGAYNTCVNCMTSRGWYRGDTSNGKTRWVVSGRVLNTHPPKFAIARKVLKDVLLSVDSVRFGAAIFGPDQGYYDPPVVISPIAPACDKSYPVLDPDENKIARDNLVKQINSIQFTNNERSIGEALFGIGAYFSSERVDGRWSKWFKNSAITAPNNYPGSGTWIDTPEMYIKAAQPWEAGGQNRSVCWSCQASAVIVLTDGAPFNDNSVPVSKMMSILMAGGARHDDGTPVDFKPGTASPGGVNYCDQFGSTKLACDAQQAGPQGPDATNKNFMDDVAFFLAHQDLRDDLPIDPITKLPVPNEGVDQGQRVRTYTIGYGDNSPMLQSIAKAGRGKFYRADSAKQLKDAIVTALQDVKEVSTSFSGATVSSIQTSGTNQSAFIPRFIPHAGQPYEGHLFRFHQFSEFVEGCDPQKAKLGTEPLDLNKDKDCEDVFILDKPASYTLTPGTVPSPTSFTIDNIVAENKAGDWVKVNTASYNANGELIGGTRAVPFWDAQAVLQNKSASASCAAGGRCIFTMVDRDGDGKFTAADNPPVEFVKSNLVNADARLALSSYLFGAGDDFCVEIFSRQGKVYTGSVADKASCAESLVDFVRGVDVLDFDGDKNVTEDRPCSGELPGSTKNCKLGDIFHSTPVVVDPPVEPFLCDIALHPQCVRTLYADFAEEGAPPVGEPTCTASSDGSTACYEATEMVPKLDLKTGNYGAYGVYKEAHASRDRVILVGANDGMLHAFLAGKVISGKTKSGFADDIHDLGTGEEIWAFIPPDLLPKLGRMVKRHEYFVDGTPMVRDIWADGANGSAPDGKKQPDEFKTVAIIAERGGGTRYLALDMTDPYAMKDPTKKPFRWMFPQACDPDSATMGETWSNFAPKPPPIGPVRLKNPNATGNKGNRRGWDERWIAFLNGGYSHDLARGRGVYMVDAWTGEKIWSFTADAPPGGTGQTYKDYVQNMMFPMVAAPALLDVGKVESVKADQDGFFDTAIVPDIGGQVWTFRFFAPGDTGSGGVVTNWFGARSFESRRVDARYNDPRQVDDKLPFFNMTSNTLQPETGWLRTFVGSGDRDNLRDTESRSCAPDNLLACSRLQCDVQVELDMSVNGRTLRSNIEFGNGKLTRNETTAGGAVSNTCLASRLELNNLHIKCEPPTSLGTKKYEYTASTRTNCVVNSGLWDCNLKDLDPDMKSDLQIPIADLDQLPRNRFYGFHSYGGPILRFSDEASALEFDARRATDIAWTGTCSGVGSCSLKDVTIPTSALTTCTDAAGNSYQCVPPNYSFTRAGPFDRGWFIEYGLRDEKTSAGSTILGGIVFWPTYRPPAATTSACAPPSSGDRGRSWQADIISGAPDQALSFQIRNATGNLTGYAPFKERNVSSPPPEPAATVAVSKNGRIRYGISIIEPGPGDGTGKNGSGGKANPDGVQHETLRENSDIASDVYWLEVSRREHLCRHVDGSACK